MNFSQRLDDHLENKDLIPTGSCLLAMNQRTDRRNNDLIHNPKRKPIPEEDLIVLEKIYNKQYEDCGRKRVALLRYIELFKEEPHKFKMENVLRKIRKHKK